MLATSRRATAAAIRLAGHHHHRRRHKITGAKTIKIAGGTGTGRDLVRVFSTNNNNNNNNKHGNRNDRFFHGSTAAVAAAAAAAAIATATATAATVTLSDRRLQPQYPQPDTMVPSPVEAPTTLPQGASVNSPPARPDLPIFSRDEVAEHCDEDSLWYTFRG